MKKHGKGYLFFVNGNKYIGEFERGKINGQGSYYNSNGDLKGSGIWKEGNLV